MQEISLEFQEMALDTFEALSCPRSLTCAILLRSGDWGQLSSLKLSPSDYNSASEYFSAAQATSLLKKLELSDDALVAPCKQLFIDCERVCYTTNRRLSWLRSMRDYPLDTDPSVLRDAISILELARRTVSRIIGRCPPWNIVDGRFGPGATFQLSAADSSLLHKLSSVPEATSTLRSRLSLFNLSESAWFRSLSGGNLFEDGPATPIIPIVRGNRWTSVPKDASRRRSIAVEPSLNLFLQLGIGAVLRRRLNEFGLLLDPDTHGIDSQSLHRNWAREASITGDYATIDLSNASDTICSELVRWLLPGEWHELLDAARSRLTLLDGHWYHLEKFSSMGNGFTFELETMLFFSLVSAFCEFRGIEGAVSVYGDDIIVPVDAYDSLIPFLSLCGFSANVKKSYARGPFRESCGGDYWRGVDVRPVYLKKIPTDPFDWMVIHNLLSRVCDIYPGTRRALNRIRSAVPRQFRRVGANRDHGDLGFHGVPIVLRRNPVNPGSFDRLILRRIPKVIKLDRVDASSQICAALYGVPSQGCSTRTVSGFRTDWTTHLG